MEDIVRSYRQQPAKTVKAEADERVRAKRASLDREAHCDAGGVPSRCRQTLENCFLGSFIVQMKRLRIVFGGELLDIIFRDLGGPFFEPHSKRQALNPFNHRPSQKISAAAGAS